MMERADVASDNDSRTPSPSSMTDTTDLFDIVYEHSVPPMTKAIRTGDLKAVRDCLKKGFLPQTPDNRGWCSIHTCIHAGQLEALKLILNFKKRNKKYLTNIATWEGETPLIIATKTKNVSLDIVKLLLDSGANPKTASNDGMTPLHWVCKQNGGINIVRSLIEHGASADAKENVSGFTALHYALSHRDMEVVKYVVDYSNVTICDHELQTALYKACVGNYMDAVKYILMKDASSVNILPRNRFSALSAAALHGNLQMVEYLLMSGADTSVRGPACFHLRVLSENEFLPIHSALMNIDVFKLLLRVTKPSTLADYEKTTRVGSLPIYFMMLSLKPEWFEALLQYPFRPEFQHLKTVQYDKLVDFLQLMDELDHGQLVAKVVWFFKYCASFEPEGFFEAVASAVSSTDHEFLTDCRLIRLLSGMGVSSCSAFSAKQKVLQLLENTWTTEENTKGKEEALELLKQPVLSLKQLSRVAFRRVVREKAGSDWGSYIMIKDSDLPSTLKDYIWYQSSEW